MNYERLESKIDSLLEEMEDEVLNAAFLQDAYDIADGQVIELGPLSEEQVLASLPHIESAFKLARRLEKACLLFKRKYRSTDDIKVILEGLQDVYDMHDTAKEYLNQHQPKV